MPQNTTAPSSPVPELVALWGIQDTLLQQYRTIFITMQSIFIAVAATLLSAKVPWIPMTLLTVLGSFTLWLWITICRSRGRGVYLLQFLAMQAEAGVPVVRPVRTLKDFQDKKHPEIETNELFRALEHGRTRWKLEFLLPIVFSLAWVFLWAILALQHYNVLVVAR
jgi:hypothetical protein